MPTKLLIGAVIAVISLYALDIVFQHRTHVPDSLAIQNACKVFGAEESPGKTPALRLGAQSMELVLSFTPAANAEVTRISAAVAAGTKRLQLASTNTELTALRVEDGHLVVGVASVENAKDVLGKLCFDDSEVSALTLARAR
jgi:hypothetical protein